MFPGAGSHPAATGCAGGSPSDRGSAASSASAPISSPARERTGAGGHNGYGIQGDDCTPSPQTVVSKKKKRGECAVSVDKKVRGLREFSMRVCDKVQSKGITTYNEVADELVAEFSNPNINIHSPDHGSPSAQQYDDEKNIRRRVYDALNVLKAMEIISKNKNEIQWRGPPTKSIKDIEELKTDVTGLKDRIEKKKAYLKDLEEQYACLQNLVQRNKQLHGSGGAPSGTLALPFLLVQAHRDACVEVEMTEDSQTVHLDFNSTPFRIDDETFVMKAMGLCGDEETNSFQSPVANGGMLKGRANHEH